MRSMIWSAVLVHVKGRALALQNLIQSSSAVVSWTAGALCAGRLSQMTWMASPGLSARRSHRGGRGSRSPLLGGQPADDLARAVFSAANRSMVPCRV